MINETRQEILLSSELRRKINWVIKYTSSNVNIINEAYESSKNMLNTNHINSVLKEYEDYLDNMKINIKV